MSLSIDLNCDMGESFGAWRMGADEAVMPWITSANIACGAHAGDPQTMHATVQAAQRAGVAIGAHIGLPDKEGFGRRRLDVSAHQTYCMTVTQLGALRAITTSQGCRVVHLKPHGALYHMAEQQQELSDAICDAVRAVDANIRVVGRAQGRLVETARNKGLSTSNEAFADRRYQADGSLLPRHQPGAVIEATDDALQQALLLACEGKAKLAEGGSVTMSVDTLCIHGDHPGAAEFAQRLHDALRKAGLELRSQA